MKQFKSFLKELNEPKKIIAFALFLLAFFALVNEVIRGYYLFKNDSTIAQPAQISQLKTIEPSSIIFKSTLFGNYIPVDLSKSDIKESMLNLKLMGILYSPNKTESQAIISDGKEEKYYFIGDSLPEGAVIKEIRPDSVVVLYEGVLESLSLPKSNLTFEPLPKPLLKDQ